MFDEDMKKHACDQCTKRFTFKSQLDRHMDSHVDDKPFKCPSRSCKTDGFKSKASLKRHMEQHSGELVECLVEGCSKKFTLKHYHTDHMNNQHGPPKECEHVLKGCTFTTQACKTLNEHQEWYCDFKSSEEDTQ